MPTLPTAPTRRQLLAWAALGAGGAGTSAVHAGDAPLRFGYFDAFEPLSGPGSQGAARGLLVQSVDLVAQTAGLASRHHAYPWRRAQALVEQGGLDGYCTSATPQRERMVQFGREPLHQVRYLAFHRRGDARLAGVRQLEDLRALRQGAFRGSGFSEAHLEPEHLRFDDTIDSVLRRIALGDLDVITTAELPGWHALQRLGLQGQIEATPLPFLRSAPFCIGLRRSLPGHAELLARLDRATRELHRQGALEKLAAAYRPPA